MVKGQEAVTAPSRVRRLNLTLPEEIYNQLHALAKREGQSMKAILRQAFALVKVAHDARRAGHKLVVLNQHEEPVKELVLLPE